MTTDALPCIVCAGLLENVFDDVRNQPANGTAFGSTGHYGSTVLDSFPGHEEFMEINICDRCLKKRLDTGFVYYEGDNK